jgi:hypothetical protein
MSSTTFREVGDYRIATSIYRNILPDWLLQSINITISDKGVGLNIRGSREEWIVSNNRELEHNILR